MCGCFRRVFTVLIFLQPAAQGPNDRGDYADYHAYLDKLERDRNNRQNAPGNIQVNQNFYSVISKSYYLSLSCLTQTVV
jgi:hypothetical protein